MPSMMSVVVIGRLMKSAARFMALLRSVWLTKLIPAHYTPARAAWPAIFRRGKAGRNGRRRDMMAAMKLAPSRRTFLQHASGALVSLGAGALSSEAQGPTTQVFYDAAMLRHEPSGGHPESPKRLETVAKAVRGLEAQGRLSVAAPRPATEDEILIVHTPQYLKLVRNEIATGRQGLSTGD